MNEEENIDDQPTDNSPKPPENNYNFSEPLIINEQQQSKNMEVHKHPHHVTHRKKRLMGQM